MDLIVPQAVQERSLSSCGHCYSYGPLGAAGLRACYQSWCVEVKVVLSRLHAATLLKNG